MRLRKANVVQKPEISVADLGGVSRFPLKPPFAATV